MKEYIERTAVHELVKCLPKYQMFSYDRTESLVGINPDDIDFGVDKIPAADVAEVVHCQDCKYRIYKDMGFDIGEVSGCQIWGAALPRDFYCAHGARMDKEDEHEVS